MNKKRLTNGLFLVLLIVLTIFASYYNAMQVTRAPSNYNFSITARPLLNYTSMDFQEYSMMMDVWNESFEVSLNTENHYWYGGGVTAVEGTVVRNNTLDSGFEEVSSSSLNPNVNLPSWFIYQVSQDVTVKTLRSSTVKYAGSYSAYVETRFANTTAEGGYAYQTPSSIYDSCGYSQSPPSATIDDNTATEWKHTVDESPNKHWIIYDLGQSYLVTKVRVYSGGTYLIDDVDIYVSDNTSDFGSKLVELWDPSSYSSWNESPSFYKTGRFVKLEFGTTHFQEKLQDAFYEFDAYVQTDSTGHVTGGLKVSWDYFVKVPYVYLSDSPNLTSVLFVDDAGTGSGYCDAYYIWVEVNIQNNTSQLQMIYVAPITGAGSPSLSHFTNTTVTKYIYGAATINSFDTWVSFTRDLKSDYESIWGTVYNATISHVAIENDLYNPTTESETNTPYIKANYDAASLILSTDGNEEELINGGFEASGWIKTQENKLAAFNYTKDSTDSKQGTTSYFMNVTGNTAGGSGSGFDATKHGVVALDSSSFIREANDTNVQRLRGFIKIETFSNLDETEYSYTAVRLTFKNLSNPTDIRYLFYCIMLQGDIPSSSSTQKYVELVKFYTVQPDIWYELSRRPMADSQWINFKITEVALVTAFYYGESYSSTGNGVAAVRFDYIGIVKEEDTEVLIRESLRSTDYALDGIYSLRQNKSLGGVEYDLYESGSENVNNTFYVAFPYYMNFSCYHYIASYEGAATIQVSLAIDDGPNYGEDYLYELIYYYGSSSGVDPIFLNDPSHQIEIFSSITTLTWTRLMRNWTVDIPDTWPLVNPRVEAVGLKVWTTGSIDAYWDLTAFYGLWYGTEKSVKLQSINEIYVKKFNITDLWSIKGDIDPGTDDFVDNNSSDVDSTQDKGSHGNFTNEQYGPDLKYDTLTEGYADQYITNLEDFIDNNSSDVDSYSDRGSHSDFPAEQAGPDSSYDTLIEEDMGPGLDVEDFVDNNSSDVDFGGDKGSHSDFPAEQAGPDSSYDTLTEENTNPPPNDVVDYVDNNSSDVDFGGDKGSHSDFPAEQAGPDSSYDTLTEENTNPPPNDVVDYVDNNSSDVDGVADLGTHGNFTAEQYGPDSTYDTLTEEYTGIPATNIEDFVDNNSSDVDGVADLGTHGNFTAEQYGPDSIYDTLIEENTGNGTGTWTTPTDVYDKCGEESSDPATATIDDWAISDWRHLVTERHWIIYDMGKKMLITKVRIYSGTTPQQYTVEDVNVYVSDDTVFDESEKVVTDWDVPKGGWDVSPSFSAMGRYIKLENMSTTQPSSQMKMAFYEFDAWTVARYELDLEVQWTSVDYNQTMEELCIYCGTMGSEDLRVDAWNGSSWQNLQTDLYAGWNNISVSSYLTSSNFTIRFQGGSETDDETGDTWQIDAALLHVWTPEDPNYELDLEVQWTNVDYNEEYEELCIYTGALGSEDINVDYWTGSGWTTLFTDLTANSWNNITVSLTGVNYTIRFSGASEVDDASEDTWQIDAVLLHVWTPDIANYELDLEVQWTGVDYDEIYEELCIYTGSLESEDIQVQVWSGSWITVFTNLTANTWNNISVASYLTTSTFTIRFRGGDDSGDTVQNTWQIDTVLLHLWTPDEANYELDLEVQWTGVDYDEENEMLCVYAGDLDSENIMVEVWTGVGWHTLFADLTANSWNNVSVATYLTGSTFTIRFKGGVDVEDTNQDDWLIDAVLLHIWTEGGYQLDLEVQFTGVDYNEVNEVLCIYAGDLGSENIQVGCWIGGQWVTLLSDLAANSWNNVSVSPYLTGSTFTIRFKGGEEVTEDTTQDTWAIDAVLLHIWTFIGYQLDLEVQFTDVATSWRSGELRVYTGDLSGENLRVDYWDGETWKGLKTSLTSNSWNTASIPLNSTITIRFRGGTEVEDTVQDSWEIDAVIIHSWYIYASQTINRANSTSANQWYYKWWDLRKIHVINETDTYEISGNSTSEGILSFYDNDWNPGDDTTIYNNDTSGYVRYNVTDFKLTAYNKSVEHLDYIEIRYVILFCRPLGVFKYLNENNATAANDPDEYGGVEYWLLVKQGETYVNYITLDSTLTVTYLPTF